MYGGGFSKQSTTINSTATASVFGSVVYVGYTETDGNGGSFAVTVDGNVYGPYYNYGQNNALIATQGGATSGPAVVRIGGLPSATHTVVVTAISATNASNVVQLDWIGSNGVQSYAGGPTVLLGGIPIQNGGYADAVVDTYSGIVRDNARILSADGLNVGYANVPAYLNKATDFYSDGVHLVDSGETHVAAAYVSQLYGANTPGTRQALRNTNSLFTSSAGSVGVNTVTPASTFEIDNSAPLSAAFANPLVGGQLVLASPPNSLVLPQATLPAQRMYLGSFYTYPTGSAAVIESSNYYSGVDHNSPLYLNPMNGGGVSVGTSAAPPTSGLIVSGSEGVGTTSPNNPLEVDSAAAYSSSFANIDSAQLMLASPGGTTAERTYIGSFFTNGVNNTSAIQSSNWYASADHTAPLFLNPVGGGVSIGTSLAPVNGASVTVTAPIAVGVYNLMTSLSYTNPYIMETLFQNGHDTTGILAPGNGGTDGNVSLYVMGNQTVGIGTGNVSSALGVYGGVSVGTAYSALAAPTNGAIIQGNVGIGTSSASTAMQVAGTVTATAFAGSGASLTLVPTTALTGALQSAQFPSTLGVGTSSPATTVEIDNSAAYSSTFANIGSSQLMLVSPNATTGQRTYIGSFFTGGTGSDSVIESSNYYAAADHVAALYLNPNGGGVSIGTASPPSGGLAVAGVIDVGGQSSVANASISMTGAVAVGAYNMVTSNAYTYPNIMETAYQNSTDTTEIFAPGNNALDANPTLYVMGNQTVGVGTGLVPTGAALAVVGGISGTTRFTQAAGRAVNTGTTSDTIGSGIASTYENANSATTTLTFAAPKGDGERRRVCLRNAATVTWAVTSPATAVAGLPTTFIAGQCVEAVYNSASGTPTNAPATTWVVY